MRINVSTYTILLGFQQNMNDSKNGKNAKGSLKGSLKIIKVILNEIDTYFCQLKNKTCSKTFGSFGVCTMQYTSFDPKIYAQRFSKHGNKRTISC